MLAKARASGLRGELARGRHRPLDAGRPVRRRLRQRRAAMAAGPRGAAAAAARASPAGRRARGPDAAQFRRALACAAARGRRGGALGPAAAPVAAGRAGRRARLVLRSAGAARGRPRHLGDRVPPGAGGRGPGAGLDPVDGAPPGPGGAGSGRAACVRGGLPATPARRLPRRPDGRTLFPFRRLFIVVCRSG